MDVSQRDEREPEPVVYADWLGTYIGLFKQGEGVHVSELTEVALRSSRRG